MSEQTVVRICWAVAMCMWIIVLFGCATPGDPFLEKIHREADRRAQVAACNLALAEMRGVGRKVIYMRWKRGWIKCRG